MRSSAWRWLWVGVMAACALAAIGCDRDPSPFENADPMPQLDKYCAQRKLPPHMYSLNYMPANSDEDRRVRNAASRASCEFRGTETFPNDPRTYERLFCCP